MYQFKMNSKDLAEAMKKASIALQCLREKEKMNVSGL